MKLKLPPGWYCLQPFGWVLLSLYSGIHAKFLAADNLAWLGMKTRHFACTWWKVCSGTVLTTLHNNLCESSPFGHILIKERVLSREFPSCWQTKFGRRLRRVSYDCQLSDIQFAFGVFPPPGQGVPLLASYFFRPVWQPKDMCSSSSKDLIPSILFFTRLIYAKSVVCWWWRRWEYDCRRHTFVCVSA